MERVFTIRATVTAAPTTRTVSVVTHTWCWIGAVVTGLNACMKMQPRLAKHVEMPRLVQKRGKHLPIDTPLDSPNPGIAYSPYAASLTAIENIAILVYGRSGPRNEARPEAQGVVQGSLPALPAPVPLTTGVCCHRYPRSSRPSMSSLAITFN